MHTVKCCIVSTLLLKNKNFKSNTATARVRQFYIIYIHVPISLSYLALAR